MKLNVLIRATQDAHNAHLQPEERDEEISMPSEPNIKLWQQRVCEARRTFKIPGFFNAVEFPAITYKSTAVHFKGDKPASVDGNLTIMGVTKPVTLTIDAFNCGTNPMNKKDECGAGASAQIRRSDFGVKYGLPAIGDDVKLVFEIEAIKN